MGTLIRQEGGKAVWVPANPYCTYAEVCMELRHTEDPTGSAFYNEVMQAIENASRFIDRWMGRDYYMHDHTGTPITIDQFYPGYAKKQITLINRSPLLDASTLSVVIDGKTLVLSKDYSCESVTWPDQEPSVVLRTLNWFPTYPSMTPDPWALDRAGGRVMTVYGLFGYDQRAITDEDGNVTGYGSAGTYADSNVPNCPQTIRYACRAIAASMSGHQRKEVVGIEGQRETIATKDVDRIAKDILGTKTGTFLA